MRESAAQRLVQLGVREAVAERLRALRYGALAVDDDVGHLAVEDAQRELGHRRDRGPAQGAAERVRELAIGDRRGSGGVDRAAPAVAVERGEVDADDVVDVDPRHVLAAARDRAADAEPEEREHLRQRAAAAVEHDAGAHAHDAHAELLGCDGLALPRGADAREEVVARAGVLGDRLVAASAVVADRRRRDEHPGPRLGRAQAGDEVARSLLARLEQPALDRGGPAPAGVLAGEVDDAVASGERRRRRRLGLRSPAVRLDAELRARLVRAARQHSHLVAARVERVDEPGPDPPGRAGYRYAHGARLRRGPITAARIARLRRGASTAARIARLRRGA